MAQQKPMPIKWQELKLFVNSLSEEELQNDAIIIISDEEQARKLLQPFRVENDIYVNYNNHDDHGSIDQLKEIIGSSLDMNDYFLSTKKGTPFLWSE